MSLNYAKSLRSSAKRYSLYDLGFERAKRGEPEENCMSKPEKSGWLSYTKQAESLRVSIEANRENSLEHLQGEQAKLLKATIEELGLEFNPKNLSLCRQAGLC